MTHAPVASSPGLAGLPEPAGALLYLYAIADTTGGVGRLLTSEAVPGLDASEPLFTLESGGLLAVVSRVPDAVFQEEPLNALLADLPRLAPYVVAHEEAVRRLAGASSGLIPMSFGTVYRGVEPICALLTEQSDVLRALLERVRGKEEWGLKLFVDTKRLLAAAQGATEELRALADEILAASPGRAYLLGRRRERLALGEARRLLDATVEQVLLELGALSSAVRREAVGEADGAGLQLALRAAFLIDRAAAEPFRSLAGELQPSCIPLGGTLELSGPWAPYSFVRGIGAGGEGEPHGGAE